MAKRARRVARMRWRVTGIGYWGLGIVDWPQSPIPQSPIPNPHK